MKGEKDLSMSILLDFYAPLLTDKQRDAVDLYYNEDLSLGEIAEQWEISRQGVRELIKRGEQIMADAEEKLGIAEKSARIEKLCTALDGLTDEIRDESLRRRFSETVYDIRNVM